MRKWRLIIDGRQSGKENMAVDEAILTACERGESPSTIRFYRWDRTTLSTGFFQRTANCIERCRALNIPVVRRITGGRAVLHDMELTYAVMTNDAMLLEQGIMGSYKVISGCIIDAFKDLGLDANIEKGLAPQALSGGQWARGQGSESCFDSSSRHEITINNRKIVGSAQKRLKNSFLQHGSIIMDVNRDLLGSVFDVDVFMIDGIKSYIDTDIDSVTSSILKRFEETMSLSFTIGRLTDIELDFKERLAGENMIL